MESLDGFRLETVTSKDHHLLQLYELISDDKYNDEDISDFL